MSATISIWGRLCRQPEIKTTSAGKEIADCVIAAEEGWDAEKQQQLTAFYKVSFWGTAVDYIRNYAIKGTGIYVAGSLVHETWVDKDGNARTTPTIKNPNRPTLTDRKADREAEQPAPQQERPPQPPSQRQPAPTARGRAQQSTYTMNEDEIPF